jgi:large subunit ribosomal protein L4e
MAASRPTVTVYSATSGDAAGSVPLPAVLTAPIRRDVVHFVHTNIAKNHRQAYAVSKHAGEQTSAESWGTGRAVARIPRVSGGGTNRSGQGAFGNMCRKGRMFAPTKIWRRWHRHVNVNQRRYALVSALAASAVPALIQARGHRVSHLPEVPLVISGLEGITKTKQAAAAFEKLGVAEDVQRAEDSKKIRSGKGKARNRRYVVRRGPLFIHANGEEATNKAIRNLPGVDVANVDRLNLLQLAPGGHLGRFCVWTRAAFERLEKLYGTFTATAELKKGYKLPRPQMSNADLARIINSTEVQKIVKPAIKGREWARQKKNPLTNHRALVKLNPYAAVVRKTEVAAAEARAKSKAKKTKRSATATNKGRRGASKNFIRSTGADEFVRPADATA